MNPTQTQHLIYAHSRVLQQLDKSKALSSKTPVYIRVPFQEYDQDVFFEKKSDSGKVLCNALGVEISLDEIKIERAVQVQFVEEAGRKIIKAFTRDVKPNVVFFTFLKVEHSNNQMMADLLFELWKGIKTGELSSRQLGFILKNMTAVLIHHNKKDGKMLGKIMVYTDMDNGDYFAPIACTKAKLGGEVMQDLFHTIQTGELPENVKPLDVQQLYQLQKQLSDYNKKSMVDIREAHKAQNPRLTATMLQKYYDIKPEELLSMRDLIRSRNRDLRDTVEDLIDNQLINISGQNIEQFADFYANAVDNQLIEHLTARLC